MCDDDWGIFPVDYIAGHTTAKTPNDCENDLECEVGLWSHIVLRGYIMCRVGTDIVIPSVCVCVLYYLMYLSHEGRLH